MTARLAQAAVLALWLVAASALAWEPPDRAAPYLPAVRAAEQAHQLPDDLLARVLHQESRYLPDVIHGRRVSPSGAAGIAQFMPATAAEMGVDPLDPHAAIHAAARYLAWLRQHTDDWRAALAAYNWGIGRVQRRGVEQAPRETRRFVAEILSDVGL